jgi:hypothetical protein
MTTDSRGLLKRGEEVTLTDPWVASYIALWVLMLALGVVLVSLLRNLAAVHAGIAQLLPKPQWRAFPTALKTGDRLPDVEWLSVDGRRRSLSQMKGVRTAYALVTPGSELSATYLKRIVAGQDLDPLDPTLRNWVMVSIGDVSDASELVREAGVPEVVTVVADTGREVVQKWGVTSTPVTVIVDEDLRVVRQDFIGEGTSKHDHSHERMATGGS